MTPAHAFVEVINLHNRLVSPLSHKHKFDESMAQRKDECRIILDKIGNEFRLHNCVGALLIQTCALEPACRDTDEDHNTKYEPVDHERPTREPFQYPHQSPDCKEG